MIPTQIYFHQKLYGAIFKRRASGGGDKLAAESGIAATVVVVVWRLQCGRRNGEVSGAVTAIDPW